MAHMIIGIARITIADEKPIATPSELHLTPIVYPTMVIGAMTQAIARLLVVRAVANSIHDSGLINANTNIVGVSNLNTSAELTHFAPKNTRTMSSLNRAHATVNGIIIAKKTL